MKKVAVKGQKVSVFDDAGRLLWFSPEWMDQGGEMENPAECLGLRWLEYVHPADLHMALEWTKAGEGAVLRCRCHCATAANMWLDVAMTKIRAGNLWIAVGDNKPSDTPPTE